MSYVKSIATFAPTFLGYIISGLVSVNQASVNLEKFLLRNLFVNTIFVVVLQVFVCPCYSI